MLLSLPTLSFAVMGLAAPVLAARVGSHRTVILALLALIIGQLVRSLVPGNAALFLGSLVALAGIAVGNVGRRWPSALTQCVGYLIASVGPFGFGVLNGLTGGWTVPLLALCAVLAVQAVAGCLAVRPRYVEDELPPQPAVGATP